MRPLSEFSNQKYKTLSEILHPSLQTKLVTGSYQLDPDPTPITFPPPEHPRSGVERGGTIEHQIHVKNTRYPDIQPFNIPSDDKWTPGYGQSHPKCGKVRFKIVCSNDTDHYEGLARETCHRPSCPICYDTWAQRAAQDAAFRVEGYKSASQTVYNPRHIVLSPSNEMIKDKTQDEVLSWLYDEGRRLSTLLKLTAALPIPHPYRIRPEKQSEISLLADKLGMNRYEYALSQPNWKDLLYFSPHLHIIAYGRLIPSNKFYEMTGWTYRNYGSRSGQSLIATIHYLLTHAWARGNSKVCRYWFGMSTHRLLATGGGYTIEPVLCPTCKAACVATPVYLQVDGSWVNHFQNLKNAPVATRKVRFSPHYALRLPHDSIPIPQRSLVSSV